MTFFKLSAFKIRTQEVFQFNYWHLLLKIHLPLLTSETEETPVVWFLVSPRLNERVLKQVKVQVGGPAFGYAYLEH